MKDYNLPDLLRRVIAGDVTAADEIDRLAGRLRDLANHLRQGNQDGTRDPGGMSDRVQMQVIGPNGEIKQQVDTQ